jgi:hypothetical protein
MNLLGGFGVLMAFCLGSCEGEFEKSSRIG